MSREQETAARLNALSKPIRLCVIRAEVITVRPGVERVRVIITQDSGATWERQYYGLVAAEVILFECGRLNALADACTGKPRVLDGWELTSG